MTLPVDQIDNLPTSVQDMIDLVGAGPALALVKAFGGNVIKVPSRTSREGRMRGRLVEIMGETAAILFIDRYSSEKLSIPRCAVAVRDNRDRGIIAAYDAGQSVAILARQELLTERQVRTILKRSLGAVALAPEPGQHPQLALF